MPRNGAGDYSLPAGNPVSTGTTISSTWANNTLSDVGTALTQSVSKDGQTAYTGNQPMGGNRHTNVGNATARNEYATLGQVQDSAGQLINSVSGTNTITGSVTGLGSYVTGQTFRFVAANTVTGSATLNINGIGAIAITKQGANALVSGDIVAGQVVEVTYDGTQFQLLQAPRTSVFTSTTSTSYNVQTAATWDLTGLRHASGTSSTPQIDYTNTTSDSSCPSIRFFKSRSGLTTNNADLVGRVFWFGKDTSNVDRQAGQLWVQQSGAAGATFVPGQFVVSLTNASGVDTTVINATGSSVNVPVALQENATRVFSRNSAFVSSEQAVTANTDVTVAHGLAGVPAIVRVVLRCKTPELGYLENEEVDMNFHYVAGGGQVGVSADATNVYIEFGNNINLLNKLSKPNVQTITYGNWRWVVRAWY